MNKIVKPDVKDGMFAFITEGTAIDHASATFAGGFARITAKAAAASYFDGLKDSSIAGGEALDVEDIILLPAWVAEGNPLTDGDTVVPFSFEMDDSCWVTDRGRSMTRDLQDKTSQGNVLKGEREYGLSPLQNETGSISGMYAIGSSVQRSIDSQFTIRVVDAGTKKTKVPIQAGRFMTVLRYYESSIAGDIEIFVFRRMIIQSVDDAGIPQNGVIPYNFGYTVEWKRQYEHTVEA